MMPTVPGHPHQIPVGSKKTFGAKPVIKTESIPKIEKTIETNDSKTDVKTENGVEETQKTSDSTTDEKITNSNEALPLPLNESTPVPNLDDLMSPTDPIPIEIRLSEAANDVSESAYVTPETSPEKTKRIIKEESLPWLYFAVFDGHAGQSLIASILYILLKLK